MKLGVVVMGVGFLVVGLAVGYYFSSDAQEACVSDRERALALAEQAVAAEGTPEAEVLMAEAQDRSQWADLECATADSHRQTCLMIGAFGAVVLAVGAVLFARKPKVAAG